jgi:SPP1 family predicted phage head-tail adaptor
MRAAGRIRAGDLRERITIEQRSAGVDALGQPLTTWATVATVWAKAEPLRGREFFAAGQLQGELSVKFTIRHRADVAETMRVLWRGQAHEIVAPPINVDGARDALELMCMQGVRDGR